MTQARLSEQEAEFTVATEQLCLQHGGRLAYSSCRASSKCRGIKTPHTTSTNVRKRVCNEATSSVIGQELEKRGWTDPAN
uniref:Uncharacterized protein n=1 Tax=Peronospora matthiolae TaxID=2874970 RepID=A0AAV1T9U5_9STRA